MAAKERSAVQFSFTEVGRQLGYLVELDYQHCFSGESKAIADLSQHSLSRSSPHFRQWLLFRGQLVHGGLAVERMRNGQREWGNTLPASSAGVTLSGSGRTAGEQKNRRNRLLGSPRIS